MASARVLIYRDHLLGLSESFIKNQAEQLGRYEPYFIGSKRVPGHSLPHARVIVVNEGGALGFAGEALYKVCGIAPSFVEKIRNAGCVLAHVHFGSCATRFLPIWKKLGMPLIVTFHGQDATTTDADLKNSRRIRDRLYLKRRKLLSEKASLFIAVSNFIRGKLIDQGYPEEKVMVHYTGVDTGFFSPDPLIEREPLVLFVGRLVEKKGCEYLIRAMKVIQEKHPDVELIVIGDGPLRQSLENEAAKSLLSYRFLGSQAPEQVKAWMNRAKVFSVPSITARSGDSEGFGMVFAESQAMGLPVVSFASGGISEAIAHNQTGFLAMEKDWKALANFILTLIEEDNVWQRFSRNGRLVVSKKFNLQKQTERLEEVYDELLRRQPLIR